jgi:hypothetical protein
MAPDERDRRFDKALARHLRSVVPAAEVVGIPADPASLRAACPDPETLAAYHERSLLPEQLNSLKEHLVGCANCQTVLAHLETTDDISLQSAEQEQVISEHRFALEKPAQILETVPVAAAPSQSQRPVAATPPKKSRRLLLMRGARWQWLAPAGALAAGLLVWVALHENQPLPLQSSRQNEIKMAQNKVPPAPVPPVSTAMPQSSAPPKPAAALTRPQSPAEEFGISNDRRASAITKQSQMLSDAVRTRAAKSTGDKELRARKDDARDASADLSAAAPADLDAKNLPLTSRDEVQLQTQAQAPPIQTEAVQPQVPQTQNQVNNYVSQKVAGPSPLNQAEPLKKAKRETAAAPAPSAPAVPKSQGADGGAAANYSTSESLVVTGMISNPRLISPPGSIVVWRAGRSGLIEFSKDGGSSWSRQTSGVLVDLLTGSAPSAQVCWMVGRVGAILLTTDGGAHWKILPSPLTEDLGGVRAADALHAMIWNARSTKSFETSDGGLTWKPVPNQ